MKFFREKLKVFFFLGLFPLFCQTIFSQKDHCVEGLYFDEILSRFTTRRTISPEPVNKDLIDRIPKRKVGFELSEKDEKTLRDAGADDLVIKLILENVLPEIRGSSSLYKEFSENYQSNDVENLKTALNAAEEFVRKFENKECYADLTKFYQEAVEAISLYIKFLSNYQSNDVNGLRVALETAKEFVRKFEKNNSYTEQVEYFKNTIPKLIDAINSRKQY